MVYLLLCLTVLCFLSLSVYICLLYPAECLKEKRAALEDAIQNYKGEDPLLPWLSYIGWTQETFVSGGKRCVNELNECDQMQECLTRTCEEHIKYDTNCPSVTLRTYVHT